MIYRGHLLLALVVIGRELLEADDAAANKLVIVHHMVGLKGEHALDVMSAIAKDEAISLVTLRVWSHLLDLKTL